MSDTTLSLKDAYEVAVELRDELSYAGECAQDEARDHTFRQIAALFAVADDLASRISNLANQLRS